MREGNLEKPNKNYQRNAYREMMEENIGKKKASGQPLSELEKAFLREEDTKKILAAQEEIEERAQERREGHAP